MQDSLRKFLRRLSLFLSSVNLFIPLILDYPGGQESCLPPSTCMCMWNTLCAPFLPSFTTSLYPLSSNPFSAATFLAVSIRWPRHTFLMVTQQYLDNRVFRHCINQSESRQGRYENSFLSCLDSDWLIKCLNTRLSKYRPHSVFDDT